jgi:TolA-binding protein
VGKYDEAAESLRAGLRGYTEGELTTALLLQGQALLRSYETSAAKPRQKLLAAGLSLMRVVAFAEPSDPEVPQALFLAAQVCERLGNRVAAENARRALVQRYGKTDWARKVQPGAPGGR